MQLSHIERVMLANQYKILSLLDPDNAEGYDKVREAIENGYVSYYSDAFSREVYEDELSPDESRLVIYAMDLYWALQVSYRNLEDDDKAEIDEARLDFPGFDGNYETKFVTYCQFVVEKEQRFSMLKFAKDRGAGEVDTVTLDRYNSHMPMVDTFRKRVEYWNPLQDRHKLPAEEIRAILEIH